MTRFTQKMLLAAVVLLAGCDWSGAQSEPTERIERESLYNRIVVERRGSEVDMIFRLGRGSLQRQTAVDLTDPMRLVIPYTETMLATAFVQPDPKKVLQIGLGGGALNRFLTRAYPTMSMQTAEIDREVLRMATDHMGYEPTDRDKVSIIDGRMFVKRNKELWDWIYVDAFKDGFAPPHLKTREFFELLESRLAPGGVIGVNLHSGTALFRSDLATLKAVFSQVYTFQTTGAANVIAIAYDGTALADPPAIPDQAPNPVRAVLAKLQDEFIGPVTDLDAPVLTDDYAPTEYLQSLETGR